MAKRSFKSASWTTASFADTVSYTAKNFMAIIGGSGTQRNDIWEVYIGGQAPSTSSPSLMVVSRDSTVEVTPTALGAGESDAALDPATAALAAPPIAFTAAATFPQRSATLGLLNLGFNAYGGIVRWAAPDEHSVLRTLGNTASLGEVSLSAYTGTTAALIGAHIIYEPI